jgi:hypothetical protein
MSTPPLEVPPTKQPDLYTGVPHWSTDQGFDVTVAAVALEIEPPSSVFGRSQSSVGAANPSSAPPCRLPCIC